MSGPSSSDIHCGSPHDTPLARTAERPHAAPPRRGPAPRARTSSHPPSWNPDPHRGGPPDHSPTPVFALTTRTGLYLPSMLLHFGCLISKHPSLRNGEHPPQIYTLKAYATPALVQYAPCCSTRTRMT